MPPRQPDRNLFVRNVSPGTFQRLHVAKARLGCETWNDFIGETLELVERNLGPK